MTTWRGEKLPARDQRSGPDRPLSIKRPFSQRATTDAAIFLPVIKLTSVVNEA